MPIATTATNHTLKEISLEPGCITNGAIHYIMTNLCGLERLIIRGCSSIYYDRSLEEIEALTTAFGRLSSYCFCGRHKLKFCPN